MTHLYESDYWEGRTSNYHGIGFDAGFIGTAEALRPFLPVRARLLDLGTGPGTFVAVMRELGVEAYGVDISQYALSRTYARAFVVRADCRALPIREGQFFDAVTSFEFLEHLRLDEVGLLVSELTARLKLGGLHVHRVCWGDCATYANDKTHVTPLPEASWRGLFHYWGLVRQEHIEQAIDARCKDRDWFGRHLVYRKVR